MLRYPRYFAPARPLIGQRAATSLFAIAKWWEYALLLVVLGGFAVARYRLVTVSPDMGWDIANYLVTMNKVFGDDPSGYGLVRPPLIAFPLKAAAMLFGPLAGAKIVAIGASVAIGAPMYFLARRIAPQPFALFVAAGFVSSIQFPIMMVWGFITLLGIFFSFAAMAFFLEGLNGNRRYAIAAGISASLTVGSHQVSAVILVLLFALWGSTALIIHRENRRQLLRILLLTAAVMFLASLPYVPAYLSQLSNMASVASSGAGVDNARLGWSGMQTYYEMFFPNAAFALAIVSTSFVGIVFAMRRNTNLGVLAIVFTVMWFVAKLAPFDHSIVVTLSTRLDFFSYAVFWIGIAAFSTLAFESAHRIRSARWNQFSVGGAGALIAGGLLFLIVVQVAEAQDRIPQALRFFHYLGQNQNNAVAWVARNTEVDAAIGVYPQPLGWWIEGLAQRHALEIRDRTSGVFRQQLDESLVTELILSRASGIHNGKWLAATMYPYRASASGTPLIRAYVGGNYYDAFAIDDFGTSFQLDGPNRDREIILSDIQTGSPVAFSEDVGRFSLATEYARDDLIIKQNVRLADNSDEITIEYFIVPGSAEASLFSLKMLLLQPNSRLIELSPGKLRIELLIRTSSRGNIFGEIAINATIVGGQVAPIRNNTGGVGWLEFKLDGGPAIIVLRARPLYSEGTIHAPQAFDVSDILRDSCLGYLIVDEELGGPLTNGLSWRTIKWLDDIPFMRQRITYGTVHIYEVVPDKVPGYHAACDSGPSVEQAGG